MRTPARGRLPASQASVSLTELVPAKAVSVSRGRRIGRGGVKGLAREQSSCPPNALRPFRAAGEILGISNRMGALAWGLEGCLPRLLPSRGGPDCSQLMRSGGMNAASAPDDLAQGTASFRVSTVATEGAAVDWPTRYGHWLDSATRSADPRCARRGSENPRRGRSRAHRAWGVRGLAGHLRGARGGPPRLARVLVRPSCPSCGARPCFRSMFAPCGQ